MDLAVKVEYIVWYSIVVKSGTGIEKPEVDEPWAKAFQAEQEENKSRHIELG